MFHKVGAACIKIALKTVCLFVYIYEGMVHISDIISCLVMNSHSYCDAEP